MNPAHRQSLTASAMLAVSAAGTLVLLLSGCLVIPVDYHSAGSRHNVSAEVKSQLQPGLTAKEDVFLMLGEPDYASEDGRRLGYAWRKVKVIWMVFAGSGGMGGEIEKSYLLQVSFDPSNRVSRVDMPKKWGDKEPCERD